MLDTYSKMQSLPEQCLESIFTGLKMKKDLGEMQFMTIELEELEVRISELQSQFETELQGMSTITRTHRPQSAIGRRILDQLAYSNDNGKSDAAEGQSVQRQQH